MKKILSSFANGWVAASLMVLSVAALSGCSKSLDSGNYQNNIPVAGLMAFNLTADKTIGVSLSGSYLTSQPLGYSNYTGSYLRIYAGNRSVEAQDGYTGNLLASTPFTFDSSRYYSAFVMGANGAYRNVVAKDNFDSLSGANGQAYIRYVNAITDSVNAANITVAANSSTIINQPAVYGSVSNFTGVAPGQVVVTVSKNGASRERTLTLEQQKVYTVLLTKVPGSGTTDSLDIRYVTNGVLDANNAGNNRTSTTSGNTQSISVQ